jgi:hypothetical protein
VPGLVPLAAVVPLGDADVPAGEPAGLAFAASVAWPEFMPGEPAAEPVVAAPPACVPLAADAAVVGLAAGL